MYYTYPYYTFRLTNYWICAATQYISELNRFLYGIFFLRSCLRYIHHWWQKYKSLQQNRVRKIRFPFDTFLYCSCGYKLWKTNIQWLTIALLQKNLQRKKRRLIQETSRWINSPTRSYTSTKWNSLVWLTSWSVIKCDCFVVPLSCATPIHLYISFVYFSSVHSWM